MLDRPGVLSRGTGKVFSAGLDLDHHFAMFARRDLKEIDNWFAAYRATNLRLFTYPRPTGQNSLSQLVQLQSHCWRGPGPKAMRRRSVSASPVH
jgi:hypothetical protein